jgi:hypothetical protein
VLDTVGQGVTIKATPATLTAVAEDSPDFEHAGKRDGLEADESSRGEFDGANCLHLAAHLDDFDADKRLDLVGGVCFGTKLILAHH